jgi:phosphomannomutase/phosphoglucomutase
MAILDETMFREYDIRGLVNDQQLNQETVRYIALGIASFLHKLGIKNTVVGHDSRSSSPLFQNIVTETLSRSGLDVIDLGMCLVPMFYFSQYEYKCQGGVYISASHNPSNWNGFKIANDYSSTLLSSQIKELYEIIKKEDFISGVGSINSKNVLEAYSRNMLSSSIIKKRLKIVIDAGNATAGQIVPDIFRKAGFEVVELYCDLDPTFPNHEPNPSAPENKKDLVKAVLANKADIGFAFDTDGDRLGVVDNQGNLLEADQYLCLLAREVLAKKRGAKIIFDVKSSQALIDDIVTHGGIPVMWKTGHSYIKAKVKEEKAPLAGELSGHIFYEENKGYDDAIYAAFKLASFLSLQKISLFDLMKTVPAYISTSTLNVDCNDLSKYQIVSKLTEEFKKSHEVIDISGARVIYKNGWGLVRASSNLPVLVLRFEAKTTKDLDLIMSDFREKMSKYHELGKDWYHG